MSDIKLIRGQIRQIVKEILPEVLNAEQYKKLEEQLAIRITKIENVIKDQMREMQERQKDTLGYLVRQTTVVKDDSKK